MGAALTEIDSRPYVCMHACHCFEKQEWHALVEVHG